MVGYAASGEARYFPEKEHIKLAGMGTATTEAAVVGVPEVNVEN